MSSSLSGGGVASLPLAQALLVSVSLVFFAMRFHP
jgi:hypothetical protein